MTEVPVFRIAVVGAGPAGLYLTDLLVNHESIRFEIDLIDRLPSPWGLIRGGISPLHPEKKLIADRHFRFVLNQSSVRFIGNLEVGKDISFQDLQSWYDGVVFACGAEANNGNLGISGEDLPGYLSAREFVGWYNGHPDLASLEVDLSHRRAAIVGNGNVALDIARILLAPIPVLERTDIADHALAALRSSKIEEVVILGRRGILEAAFHNPELEELLEDDTIEVAVEGQSLESIAPSNADWNARRKIETLTRLVTRKLDRPSRRLVLRFLGTPQEIEGEGQVRALMIADNGVASNSVSSRLPAGLIIRSTGYRVAPMPWLPLDPASGAVAHRCGRVLGLERTYATGWNKRGPSGILGSNKKCARETALSLTEDIHAGCITPGAPDAGATLRSIRQKQAELVSYSDWQRIDRVERSRGRAAQRPRIKVTQRESMFDILR